MSISTTSLDSLPMGDSNENVTIRTEEKNIVIDNKMQELQQQRDEEIKQKPSRSPSMDVNEFVSGLQKATSTGMTQLPSRDIPINQNTILKDEQVKPNFVPEGSPTDYITEHQTSEEIIKQNAKKQKSADNLDVIFSELSLPLMISVLYFMYQLPVVRRSFLKMLPMCYSNSGELKLTGYLVNSVVFGAIIYFISKVMSQLSG
jgi:hypothetical protein